MAEILHPKFPKPEGKPRLLVIYQCGACPYFMPHSHKCDPLNIEVRDTEIHPDCKLEIAMIKKVQG
jgi:hypothetical protein